MVFRGSASRNMKYCILFEIRSVLASFRHFRVPYVTHYEKMKEIGKSHPPGTKTFHL